MNTEVMDRKKASSMEKDEVQAGTYQYNAFFLGCPPWNQPTPLFPRINSITILREEYSRPKKRRGPIPQSTPQRISMKTLRSVIFCGDIHEESNTSMHCIEPKVEQKLEHCLAKKWRQWLEQYLAQNPAGTGSYAKIYVVEDNNVVTHSYDSPATLNLKTLPDE